MSDVQNPVLTYDRVDISYGGRTVVRNVSFDLAPGEILGIVGESGSGKSTIVKAAMGLLGDAGMVTRGDIVYHAAPRGARNGEGSQGPSPVRDINLVDAPLKELRALCGPELGMIFQDCLAALTPIRKIGDQIYESMRAHEQLTREECDARATELLRQLNFKNPEHVLSSYPFELSGGMGQRVGIAMAMLLRPRVLLADEPTSALDAVSQKQIIQMLLELREESGTAIVVITHNIGVVRAMADSVMVLKSGDVQEYGPAAQVLGNPQSEYTRALINAAPRLQKASK